MAYDDAGGTIAARLWWMLDDLGHHRVRVLDGGIGAWTAIGGALTAEVPVPAPGRLTLADSWSRTIDGGELAARLGGVGLIDARAPERYRGETEPVDAVGGHIPTAVSRPSGGNLAADGRFQPPEVLRARFEGLSDAGDVVTYCGSGVTACHNALAMRVAGLADPILYAGSYSDWTRAGPAGGDRRRAGFALGLRGLARAAPGTDDRGLRQRDDQRGREPDREVAQQRDLEAEQAHLGPDRQPELVPDEVERPERGDDREHDCPRPLGPPPRATSRTATRRARSSTG